MTIDHIVVSLSLSSSQITACQNKKRVLTLSLEISVSAYLCTIKASACGSHEFVSDKVKTLKF
jgi:hypothetical protein